MLLGLFFLSELPGLRVVHYGCPPCVDEQAAGWLADAQAADFMTGMVLSNDVVPRLSVSNALMLAEDLGAVKREEKVALPPAKKIHVAKVIGAPTPIRSLAPAPAPATTQVLDQAPAAAKLNAMSAEKLDQSTAQMVGMGFEASQASDALAATHSVEAAVERLLVQPAATEERKEDAEEMQDQSCSAARNMVVPGKIIYIPEDHGLYREPLVVDHRHASLRRLPLSMDMLTSHRGKTMLGALAEVVTARQIRTGLLKSEDVSM